ncbi:MAG: alpha/beta hydrolase [Bacteroidota bacterium]|nr:alpha/beta hydrolase [Bacteroidota bacterium]
MDKQRKYGTSPFKIAIIHGGPGAPGEVGPIAKELSDEFSILEPFQFSDSLNGQVKELASILSEQCELPVTLIGHSWGAMLSYITAARYPNLIKKIILIGCPPFGEKYAVAMMETRLSRLSKEDSEEMRSLAGFLGRKSSMNKNELFARMGQIMAKADSFDPLTTNNGIIEYQFEIFERVWNEAKELRKGGELLSMGPKIECPVVAIHGDYDPHPADGVKIPLAKVLKDFRFILLEKCGHTPWLEKAAKDRFYAILRKELIN